MTYADSAIRQKLKTLTNHVQEDGKLRKTLEAYVESGREIICVTKFNNQEEIMVSEGIAKNLEKKPHLVDALLELFESSNGVQISEQKLASNKQLHLPKLFAPYKDKRRGWNIHAVREQAILYLNCLGYGHGGKTLIDTKNKKADKPEWFPAKLEFGQYEHPSKASLQDNEFLIEGILNFFDFNVLTHCDFPPIVEKKAKKKDHVQDPVEDPVEDPFEDPVEDPVEVPVDVTDEQENVEEDNLQQEPSQGKSRLEKEDKSKTKAKSAQKSRKTLSQGNFMDDQETVPKKKKKKYGPAKKIFVEMSEFEKNVIMKNIEERKEMERELGLNTLAQDLRKTMQTSFLSSLDNIFTSADEV